MNLESNTTTTDFLCLIFQVCCFHFSKNSCLLHHQYLLEKGVCTKQEHLLRCRCTARFFLLNGFGNLPKIRSILTTKVTDFQMWDKILPDDLLIKVVTSTHPIPHPQKVFNYAFWGPIFSCPSGSIHTLLSHSFNVLNYI